MRVFAALPLPSEIQKAIHAWMCGWYADQPALKLVEEKNLHITLIFFGEMPERSVEEIKSFLDPFRFPSIQAALGRAGGFPPRGSPRVYYIGLESGGDSVIALQKDLAGAVSKVQYRKDQRGFKPHITCARVKKRSEYGKLPTAEELETENLKNLRFSFEEVVLFESRLSPSGPTYTPLKTVRLDQDG
jgi:2'-5' RNA ligase